MLLVDGEEFPLLEVREIRFEIAQRAGAEPCLCRQPPDPIPGPSPSGANLYYAPLYDKIKEARREDEEIAQGDWGARAQGGGLAARHQADQRSPGHPQQGSPTRRLAHRGTAAQGGRRPVSRTAWTCCGPGGAVLGHRVPRDRGRRRGVPRHAPAMGGGPSRKGRQAALPLTRTKLDWFQYKDSRTVGYEEDAASEEKRAAREQAIADGKTTGEVFDAGFNTTPKAYYVELEATYDAALEVARIPGPALRREVRRRGPSFGPLKTTVSEVRQTVRILLARRGAPEAAAPRRAGGRSARLRGSSSGAGRAAGG